MLDGVHRPSGFPEPHSDAGRKPVELTQEEINALPTIMGPVSDPDADSTARIDPVGYVYLWEPGEGIGFWVQAGYVRAGRPRFGQVIDPNDIQWFNLAAFRKKVLKAKKSLNAVRLPGGGDIWDVTSETERRAGEDDGVARAYLASDDSDVDIL